jgi:hypothetical protein
MFGAIKRLLSWPARVRAATRDGREYRFGARGTFWGRVRVASWRWSVALHKFDDDPRWVLHLFCLWVDLRRAGTPPRDPMLDTWGFTLDPESRCLHLNWRDRCKIVNLPWAMEHVRREVMLADGRFVVTEEVTRAWRPRLGRWHRYLRGGKLVRGDQARDGLRYPYHDEPEGAYRQTFAYVYTLQSGEVQVREAAVTAERRTWCWRLFWKAGLWFPKRTRAYIDVAFSDEVGERTGSWKGGCVGASYELRRGESPEACLRRMERERVFD